jgi:hypothetical protein
MDWTLLLVALGCLWGALLVTGKPNPAWDEVRREKHEKYRWVIGAFGLVSAVAVSASSGRVQVWVLVAMCALPAGLLLELWARAGNSTARTALGAVVIALGLLAASAAIPGNAGVILVLSAFAFLAVAFRLAFRVRREG